METNTTNQRFTDALGIEQLVKAGGDVSKLYNFDFTLRFPSQKAAERAELQLMGFAFSTKVAAGKTADQWSILASKKMYPVESDLAGLRDKLEAIATEGRGSYEGWKAAPAGKP